MRKLLILALFAPFAFAACAATSTGKTGAWSASSTWTSGTGTCANGSAPNAGGIPGDGDTATISTGSNITISSSLIIGAGSGTVIAVNTATSQLNVNADVTVKGNISVSGAGSKLIINASSAPVTITLRGNSGTPQILTSGSCGTGTAISFLGTSQTNYVKVTSTTADGGSLGNISSTNCAATWTFNYTILDTLSATNGLNITGTTQSSNVTMSHVLFKSVGLVTLRNDASTTFTWNLDAIDIRSQTVTLGAMKLQSSQAKTGGTRSLSNFTHVGVVTTGSTITENYLDIEAPDVTLTNIVTDRTYILSGTATPTPYNLAISNWFALNRFDTCGDATGGVNTGNTGQIFKTAWNSNQSVSNVGVINYCEGGGTGANPHDFNETGGADVAKGPNVYSHIVADGVGTSSSGDVLLAGILTRASRILSVNLAGSIFNSVNTTNSGSLWYARNWTADHTQTIYSIYMEEFGGGTASADNWSVMRNGIMSDTGLGVGMSRSRTSQSAFSLNRNVWTGLFEDGGIYAYSPQNSARSYLGLNSSGAYRVTTTATISGSSFTLGAAATGMVVGDYMRASTQICQVTAVTDTTHGTIGTNNSGTSCSIASGTSVSIVSNVWTSGTYGDDNDHGSQDFTTSPQYRDNTRSFATWDTRNGGAGTVAHAAAEVIKLNGWDASGAAATFDTKYTLTNYLSYMRWGWTPMNGMFFGAGDPRDSDVATSASWVGVHVGAVAPYPPALTTMQ
jgi:hypothetical protein